jgi:hypothetical protein
VQRQETTKDATAGNYKRCNGRKLQKMQRREITDCLLNKLFKSLVARKDYCSVVRWFHPFNETLTGAWYVGEVNVDNGQDGREGTSFNAI